MLSTEALEYFNSKFKGELRTYQGLPESDWVATALIMLKDVRTRAVFLYFEDHKLLKDPIAFKKMLEDFEKNRVDYLPYSFFRASKLSKKNLLPFKPVAINDISVYEVNDSNIKNFEKISPGYYIFSLLSVVSVRYFKRILREENACLKIRSRNLLRFLKIIYPYPKNRNLLYKVNSKIQKIFSLRFGLYEKNTPFNTERHWAENLFLGRERWNFGLLLQEFFANYDDDNGADNESLIKRGLYPFEINPNINEIIGRQFHHQEILLNPDVEVDLTYIAARERISSPPILLIESTTGEVDINYNNQILKLNVGESKMFYPNLGITVKSVSTGKIKINLYNY